GDWTPGAVVLESSGRTLETLRSGDAASISRHGALEPGTGFRLAFCRIDAFNCSIASSIGGITDAVTRLPPEPGPSGSFESPILTSISCGSIQNSRATVLAITVRVPVPISCVAVLVLRRPLLTATSTVEPGCHR